MTVLRGGPAWPPMRHPFEVAAIVAFWVIGVSSLLVSSEASPSLAAVLPPIVREVWLSGLVVGASLGAASALLAVRDPLMALLCERLFLLTIGPFAALYAFVLLGTVGVAAMIPATYFLVYAGAAFWRLWQVQVYVRWRMRAVAAARG